MFHNLNLIFGLKPNRSNELEKKADEKGDQVVEPNRLTRRPSQCQINQTQVEKMGPD